MHDKPCSVPFAYFHFHAALWHPRD